MPRPHVEFLHAQQLPWRAAPFPGGGWQGVEAKLLSRDPATGACSALLKLPPGFRRGAYRLAASQEWLLLEGAMRRGAVDYGLDDYAWLPAGHPGDGWSSDGGAVLLAFFDREPTWSDVAAAPGVAVTAGAGYDGTARGESLFILDGAPAQGKSVADVEAALRAEIARIGGGR